MWQHDNVQWLRWAGNVTECNDADTCTVVFDGGEEALIQRSCIHNIDTDSEPPRPREGAPSIVKLEEDAPRPVGKRDRILSLESMVDLVLAGAHPRLRECCDRDRIISVLEAEGAFDADAVCLLLDKRFEATMGLLGSAAPTTFLLSLHKHASGESTNPTVSEDITRESIALSTAAGSMLAANATNREANSLPAPPQLPQTLPPPQLPPPPPPQLMPLPPMPPPPQQLPASASNLPTPHLAAQSEAVPGRAEPSFTGPPLCKIFNEVEAKNRQHAQWLGCFWSNCQQYGWAGDETYSETAGETYCETHGAESLESNVGHFLGYFVPRKMGTPSAKEMEQCAATMSALVRHCVAKKYCAPQPELLDKIKISGTFDAEGCMTAIQGLADRRYWDAFETRDGGAPASAADESLSHYDYEESIGGFLLMPLEISEVRNDGWTFKDGYHPGSHFGSDNEGPSTCFVKLPSHVAKLGVVGASFSCMALCLRNGIWRPVDSFGAGVAQNVYPP